MLDRGFDTTLPIFDTTSGNFLTTGSGISPLKFRPPREEENLAIRVREHVFDACNGTVQTGPFRGMKLPRKDEPNRGTKALGCYEEELHQPLEREIARLQELFPVQPVIVNLGCSLGYYAVGLAMRVRSAMVIGVDIKPERFGWVRKAAEANAVSIATFDGRGYSLPGCDLILSDCEGAEAEYLDPERYPFLRKTVMIVETHDDTSQLLSERFYKTHDIKVALSEQARSPNRYPCLHGMHSYAKWIAVAENRPCTAPYLYLTPKPPQ
jgi:hypothetical protein